MSAQLIDGKALAAEAMERVQAEVRRLSAKGHAAHLVAVMVGESAASRMYVKRQRKSCEDVGIDFTLVELDGGSTQEDLEAEIHKLNGDPSVTGVILQMPLPQGFDGQRAQRLIAPTKDVEGVTPASLGLVVLGEESAAPVTARAAFELAKASGVAIEGAEVTIVGHSEIVGKPLALLFLKSLGTTTVCHIATKDLAAHTKKADFLCVAVGKPGLIRAEMIKPGAVVIDIGINRVEKKGPDGKPVLNDKGKPEKVTVGDVDFERACEVAGWITPVPGGVGQMTVAMLLAKVVGLAAKHFEG